MWGRIGEYENNDAVINEDHTLVCVHEFVVAESNCTLSRTKQNKSERRKMQLLNTHTNAYTNNC